MTHQAGALAVVFALTGCMASGGLKSYRDFPPAERWSLGAGAVAPEVTELVERFYGAQLDPVAIGAELAAALARHPVNATLHEIAAYRANLLGESHQTWYHFMRAAADKDAEATELYLWELDRADHTISEENASIELLRELARNHPRPTVRQRAEQHLIPLLRRRGLYKEAGAVVLALGYVDRWSLAGAFDNDQGKGFWTTYPPELSVELAAEMEGARVPVRWRTLDHLDPEGMVPLTSLVSPSDPGVAYLVSFVLAPADREAELRLSSPSPLRAFWNDAQVAVEEETRGGDRDNVVVPVRLNKGWNKLLVKVANKRGSSYLGARFTEPSGPPLAGLVFDARPQLFRRAEASLPTRRGPPWGAIAPSNRARFLAARWNYRMGQTAQALAPLVELLAAAPANPLVLHAVALAYDANGEQGKAIDLLNRGIAGKGTGAAALLIARARFYRDHQQLDKAVRELVGLLAKSPDTRAARRELAAIYKEREWDVDRCRAIEELLARSGDDDRALLELGDCLDRRGLSEPAERSFRAAHALVPGSSLPMVRLRELAARRLDWRSALAWSAKLRELDPFMIVHVIADGDLHHSRGDGAGARECYRAAAAMDPDRADPHQRLGLLAHERGDRDEAVREWRLAMERDQTNAELADWVDHLQPGGLGFLQRFIPTEEQIEAAIAGASAVKVHPEANVVELLAHYATEVKGSGASDWVATTISRAVNEKGRDALIASRVPAGARVLRAFSIDPAGERQEAASIRGGEIRFRQLGVGSIVVLQYIRHAGASSYLPSQFMYGKYFQWLSIQKEAQTWVLALPESRSLQISATAGIEVTSETIDGRKVRTFRARAVPPLGSAPYMPPADDLLRQVTVSTMAGWDDFVRLERALLAEVFRSSPQLDALAARLLEGAATPREKLDRLFYYVVRAVRYQQDYEDEVAGQRPHAAPVVVERGYGDCKDKAVLFIELARLAGLKAHFVLLQTRDKGRIQRQTPLPQFNHAIAYVPRQPGIDEPYFVDATVEALDIGNLRADDQGALSLVIDPVSGAYQFAEIPYQAPELQFDRYRIDLRVDSPTAARAVIERTQRGTAAALARVMFRNAEEGNRSFHSAVASLFAGSSLIDAKAENPLDLWHPLVTKFTADVSNAVQPEGDHFRLRLPRLMPIANAATLGERHLPLWFGAQNSLSYDVEVQLPTGYRLLQTPEDFQVVDRCFTAKFTSKSDGHKVATRYEYQRTCTELPLTDYPAFRKAVQRVVAQPRDLVFAREVVAPTPNRR